jgi:hypothetical protein
MAAVAVLVVVLVAVFAWRHDDDEAVVGQPAAMPLLLGADAEVTATTMAGSVTYVRGPDLTDPQATQDAWVVTSAAAEPAAVRRLADALGVTGDLRPVAGGWQIGTDDGPNVRVQGSTGLAWDYSSGVEPAVAAVCAGPAPATTFDPGSGQVDSRVDDSTTTSMADPAREGGCDPTPPPEGVPSAAEAEQATRALLRRAGLDGDHVDVSATSSDWTAVAIASPELGGTPTQGLDTVVTFGGGGAITRAAGILAAPTRADPYPLIGVDAAIARLNAGRHVLDRFPLRPVPATDTAVSSPTQVPATTVPVTTVPVTTVPVTTLPVTTVPATTVAPDGGPTTTVVLSSVEVVLAAVPGSDGAIWLVPAYRFETADGGSFVVLAIDDSFIASEPTTEPTPATEPAADPFPPITTGTVTTTPPSPPDHECCPPTRQADGSIVACTAACAPGSSAPVTTAGR